MASSKADPEDAVMLPDPLRKVLGSAPKLQILCQIEAGVADSDALANVLSGIRRNSVNLHLNELGEAGWIRVAELRKRRGTHARIWELSDPSFSWRALVAQLRKQVPEPVEASGEHTVTLS